MAVCGASACVMGATLRVIVEIVESQSWARTELSRARKLASQDFPRGPPTGRLRGKGDLPLHRGQRDTVDQLSITKDRTQCTAVSGGSATCWRLPRPQTAHRGPPSSRVNHLHYSSRIPEGERLNGTAGSADGRFSYCAPQPRGPRGMESAEGFSRSCVVKYGVGGRAALVLAKRTSIFGLGPDIAHFFPGFCPGTRNY